jgi:hypothetical protein
MSDADAKNVISGQSLSAVNKKGSNQPLFNLKLNLNLSLSLGTSSLHNDDN